MCTFFSPPLPDLYNPSPKDIVDVAAPPAQMIVAPPPTAAAPSIDELIHQSQWNLQQQEQHLHTLRQVYVALKVEYEGLFRNSNQSNRHVCVYERECCLSFRRDRSIVDILDLLTITFCTLLNAGTGHGSHRFGHGTTDPEVVGGNSVRHYGV